MSWNIEVEGGSSVRLPTKGKYCDRDIVVTAKGGGGLDTSDANAVAKDIMWGKTAYVKGEKVTGTLTTYNAEVTPTKEDQYIYPEDGFLFDEVCVEAIPDTGSIIAHFFHHPTKACVCNPGQVHRACRNKGNHRERHT